MSTISCPLESRCTIQGFDIFDTRNATICSIYHDPFDILPLGENEDLGEQNEKGKTTKRENCIKHGKKRPSNCIFIRRAKIWIWKAGRGGGGEWSKCTIYTCIYLGRKYIRRLFYDRVRILYAAPSSGEWGEHELDYILLHQGDVHIDPNPEEVCMCVHWTLYKPGHHNSCQF